MMELLHRLYRDKKAFPKPYPDMQQWDLQVFLFGNAAVDTYTFKKTRQSLPIFSNSHLKCFLGSRYKAFNVIDDPGSLGREGEGACVGMRERECEGGDAMDQSYRRPYFGDLEPP